MSGTQLDPSIIAQAGQIPGQMTNPLTRLSDLAQTGNQLMDLRQAKANQLAGQAFQNSIQPDGTFSQNALLSGLKAAGPGAAMAAQASAQAGGTLTTTDITNAQNNLNYHLSKMGAMSSVLGAVVTQPGGATPGSVREGVQSLVDNQVMTPQEGAGALMDMPSDPTKVQAWAMQHWKTTQDAEGQIHSTLAMLPSIATVSGAGGTALINTNQMSQGATPPGTVITTGAAPTTTVVDPSDPTKTKYLGNAPPTIIPPGGAQPAPAPTVAPGSLGGGYYPSSTGGGNGAPPQAPVATAAPAAPAVNPADPLAGQLSTAPLGTDTAATNSANAYSTFMGSVGDSPMRVFQLQKALGDLQSTNTGPGSPARNDIISYANSLWHAVDPNAHGIDPKGVAAFDMANKYLTAYAQAQANQYGGSTDSALAASFSSNPSVHISNLAAVDVVKTNIALERMNQVAGQLAQQQNVQPGQYLQWKANFGTQVDPRAFAFPDMTIPERQSLVTQLKKNPTQYTKFVNTLNLAAKYGAVTDPRQNNGGQQ